MANTTDSLTSTPACLTRTAADDRAEAAMKVKHDGVDCSRASEAFEPARNAALAAIQRREADAVFSEVARHFVRNISAEPLDELTFEAAAVSASYAAQVACAHDNLTLAQRATLLDCARRLVALAIEVAS